MERILVDAIDVAGDPRPACGMLYRAAVWHRVRGHDGGTCGLPKASLVSWPEVSLDPIDSLTMSVGVVVERCCVSSSDRLAA